MRSLLALVLVLALPSIGGARAATATAPGASVIVPAGTRLTARMNTTIGTAKALGPDRVADETHAGATFTASVTTPIFDERGRERLPAGAIIEGRIAVLAPGVGVRSARLELAPERLDGKPLQGRVVSAEVQQLQGSDIGEKADSAAFATILLGGIAFGAPGVMIGYAGGSAPAAVSAVRERRVEAWLTAGTLIEVELDEPLVL